MFKVRSTSLDFGKISQQPLDLLLENGCEFDTVKVNAESEAEGMEVIKDVDVLIVGLQRITEKVLESANRLKVIGRCGTGLDNIDLKAADSRGISVVYAPGSNAHSVADFAIGLMLALARKIPLIERKTKSGEWKRFIGNEIWGKTLGIFGLGEIGSNVAKRARGFDMNIIAYDVIKNESSARKLGVEYKSKEDILKESDFITIHLPLTEETRNLISEPELKAMKKTSIVINTARGGIIDEGALYRALKEEWIAGAALDVFENEPPVPGPLFEMDNFIPCPHLAGITMEALIRVHMTVARDILAVLNGKMPEFPANK